VSAIAWSRCRLACHYPQAAVFGRDTGNRQTYGFVRLVFTLILLVGPLSSDRMPS